MKIVKVSEFMVTIRNIHDVKKKKKIFVLLKFDNVYTIVVKNLLEQNF